MPTIEQIRAARALIGWSQGDLAEHAGLSQTGIARIENGTNHPNSTTTAKIISAFDKVDVEFIGSTGVKKRTNEVRTLRGADGFRVFIDDVYHTVKDGGEIYVVNVNDDDFVHWIGDGLQEHLKRMQSITGLTCKTILQNGQENRKATLYTNYRVSRYKMSGSVPFYVYGDKFALLQFREEPLIFIIDSPLVVEAYQEQFMAMWSEAE